MELRELIRHSITKQELTIGQIYDKIKNEIWSKHPIDNYRNELLTTEQKTLILDSLETGIQIEPLIIISFGDDKFYMYNSCQYLIVNEKLDNPYLNFQEQRRFKNIRLNVLTIFPYNDSDAMKIVNYLNKINSRI